MRTRASDRVRFDPCSEAFAAVAREYRNTLRRAEKLWRRLQRADVQRNPRKEDRTRRELELVERRLDVARRALLDHTRKVASDPMRTRVRRLGLGGPEAQVA